MQKWKHADYDCEVKAATYTDDKGNYLIRTGGSLPWRLNNPGNLRPRMTSSGKPAPKIVKSHIGFAKTKNEKNEDCYFLIFPDYETGENELRASLKRKYSEKTIKEAIATYAPKKENNTETYIEKVEKISGLSRNSTISKLNETEFDRLVKAIIKIEGYNDSSKEPRVEKQIKGTSITLTDGAAPITNQEITLRQDGKDSKLESNHAGELPTIIHLPGITHIELLIKNIEGHLEEVCKIPKEKFGKNLLLIFDSLIAKASTNTHTPKNNEAKKERKNILYTISPGDTLFKIAKKFKTTVEKIQSDNNIKEKAKIYPGQKITI